MMRIEDGCDRLEIVRQLFVEYAKSLDFDICFDGFAEELAALPGCYGPPDGRILIGMNDDEPIGCVAWRRLDASTCEMKRLFVRSNHRGNGHGRRLAEAIVSAAKDLGYEAILLHTLSSMQAAAALYRSLGFVETQPYDDTDLPGVLFLRRDLLRR